MIITIPALASEQIFEIETEFDIVDEANGIITATLRPDVAENVTYTINPYPVNQSAEVTVIDDDAFPIFSITPVATSVVESNPVQFLVSSPTTSDSNHFVQYQVRETGKALPYRNWSYSYVYQVIVPAYSTNASFELPTEDDNYAEPDEVITVTLLPDWFAVKNYTVHPDLTRRRTSVTVIDDDEIQGTVPNVTLTTSAAHITEGESVEFNFYIRS